jgi:hypothetical protein
MELISMKINRYNQEKVEFFGVDIIDGFCGSKIILNK